MSNLQNSVPPFVLVKLGWGNIEGFCNKLTEAYEEKLEEMDIRTLK